MGVAGRAASSISTTYETNRQSRGAGHFKCTDGDDWPRLFSEVRAPEDLSLQSDVVACTMLFRWSIVRGGGSDLQGQCAKAQHQEKSFTTESTEETEKKAIARREKAGGGEDEICEVGVLGCGDLGSAGDYASVLYV